MKKRLLNYKIWIVVLVICGLGYVFLPLFDVYLESKTQKLMVDGQDHPISEFYYNKIAGVTFINGNFLLFMTKPYMFHPEYGYIYSSSDATEWEQRARFNFPFTGDDKTFKFPYQVGQKCVEILGFLQSGLISSNCRENWTVVDMVAPKLRVWNVDSIKNDGLPHCNSFLHYKNSLVYVFSQQPPQIQGYDVNFTTQLIPNYASLYQTFDGIHWSKLVATNIVITQLIAENKLKPNKLLGKFPNMSKYPELDLGKLIPIAYDLPCNLYPENNSKAYGVLNKIIESNNLNIHLTPTLTTYGAGVYLGVFMDYSKYSVIKSEDGIHYTISPLPEHIISSLAGTLYQSN